MPPHQSNERKPKFGDGPKIRRYKRRWKVELLFVARPENRRRLVVRYDRRGEELPRHRASRVHRHLAAVFMRWLLGSMLARRCEAVTHTRYDGCFGRCSLGICAIGT
jgi:hypothetical protein